MEGLLCEPGPELRLLIGGREKRRANIIYGMEKKKKNVYMRTCFFTVCTVSLWVVICLVRISVRCEQLGLIFFFVFCFVLLAHEDTIRALNQKPTIWQPTLMPATPK